MSTYIDSRHAKLSAEAFRRSSSYAHINKKGYQVVVEAYEASSSKKGTGIQQRWVDSTSTGEGQPGKKVRGQGEIDKLPDIPQEYEEFK